MNPPYLLNSFFTRNSEPWSPLYFLTGGQTLCTLCTNVPYFVPQKRKLTIVNFNPSDLIRKDGDLSLEIINLQQEKTDMIKKKELNIKVTAGILGPPSITKRPLNSQIKQIIIITGLLSLFTGIFVVFFLEYIERMKARENK